MRCKKETRKLFELGKIVTTPGALDLLQRLGEDPIRYIARHAHGDWGEKLSKENRDENTLALKAGDLQLFSVYETRLGKAAMRLCRLRASICSTSATFGRNGPRRQDCAGVSRYAIILTTIA